MGGGEGSEGASVGVGEGGGANDDGGGRGVGVIRAVARRGELWREGEVELVEDLGASEGRGDLDHLGRGGGDSSGAEGEEASSIRRGSADESRRSEDRLRRRGPVRVLVLLPGLSRVQNFLVLASVEAQSQPKCHPRSSLQPRARWQPRTDARQSWTDPLERLEARRPWPQSQPHSSVFRVEAHLLEAHERLVRQLPRCCSSSEESRRFGGGLR